MEAAFCARLVQDLESRGGHAVVTVSLASMKIAFSPNRNKSRTGNRCFYTSNGYLVIVSRAFLQHIPHYHERQARPFIIL
jgi:hypothetical protein